MVGAEQEWACEVAAPSGHGEVSGDRVTLLIPQLLVMFLFPDPKIRGVLGELSCS